ncbi:hypothetical protein D1B17_11920 [Companilactobacillus zhachilii]|uniref:Transposase IS4-like domain-containing protein n=1 Tax=Companilactobacillus zhachilii TaxID=2304606 RepID=A0A386PTF2_9LACO|nr:hypothetical protein D1B17_11920 [Companilactobacillus zhachilii]
MSQEIIQTYNKRWKIEDHFKVYKQYLQLNKNQIQNYSCLCWLSGNRLTKSMRKYR